jgi:hypothetical protein
MTRLLIALALVMPVTVVVAQEGGAAAEKPKAKMASGEIVKVEDGSITIKGKKDEQTIKIGAECKITVDGAEAKVEDLKPGAKAAITLAEDGSAAKITVGAAKKKKEAAH